MKKIDLIGEYDSDTIPFGFELPVDVNGRNNDIHFANHKIAGLFNFASETAEVCKARRRAEFLCRIANGELMVDHGQVYIRTGSQYQEGKMVVSYEILGSEQKEADTFSPEKQNGNGHEQEETKTGIIESVVGVVKRRGRPRKK